MLTKKQIEAIEIGGRDDEWEMSGDLSMDDARELRRLALLGLEAENTRLSPETTALLRDVLKRDVSLYETIALVFEDRRAAAAPYQAALAEFNRCYPPEEA